MKSKDTQLIKEILLDGLQKSNFDVHKTTIVHPKEGWRTTSEEAKRAYVRASNILNVMQVLRTKGDEKLPQDHKGIEKYISVTIAEQSFIESYSLINNFLSDRGNAELIREAREAIETLKEYGESNKGASCEWQLSKKIGK